MDFVGASSQMKTKTGWSAPPSRPGGASANAIRVPAVVLACAIVIGFFFYSPALHAPFVFDDMGLPFSTTKAQPVQAWLSGVRPVLMFSYWANERLWGNAPESFHYVNVFIHVLNAFLVFLALRRVLTRAGWEPQSTLRASAAGALVFLIHPLQTESVSYIAGRSESLSALFELLAYLVYLYRRKEAISWLESLAVLTLFAMALGSKESAISLLVILIITDISWPSPFSLQGIQRNWRLYALMAPAAITGAIAVLLMLGKAPSAGFSVHGVTWYQYAFTEARAIFVYIRLAMLPVGLSVDHDFQVSHTLLERGALFWMLCLCGLTVACFRLRRRYPLACFGVLIFLAALAPTSSIVPIADPLVDRRMYLPLIGLILVGCEASRRVRLHRGIAWTIALSLATVLGGLCYGRNQAWGKPEDLFGDAAMRSIHNYRPYAYAARMLFSAGRCHDEIPLLERADSLFPGNYEILMEWGGALECIDRLDDAMVKFQAAARIRADSKVYQLIGLLYGQMNRMEDAGGALRTAVRISPNSAEAHKYLGTWYEASNDLAAAEEEYAKSLALAPDDEQARASLFRVRQKRRGRNGG